MMTTRSGIMIACWLALGAATAPAAWAGDPAGTPSVAGDGSWAVRHGAAGADADRDLRLAAAPGAPAEARSTATAADAGTVAAGEASPPAAAPAAPGTGGLAAAPAQAADPGAVPPADAAVATGDLWQRIRQGFKMPDLVNRRAAASTHWYAGQPDYISRMSARASMYLFHIVEEIEKRGMPTEIALLPFVESAMQPEAVSVAKAAGLWQFIPSTGKVYSLEQNMWKDERFGVTESTRAALDYLQKLYGEFGDWQLALAAYNCGEAAIEHALARNRAQHRPLDYSSLRLPRETQYYVPKLQAIKNIVADPRHYGIDLPGIRNQPYFVSLNSSRDIDVATAARLADMSPEDFRALNPAFHRPVIVAASSPSILLPADRVEAFQANLAAWEATNQPLASWTTYTLQPGETLEKLALRLGLTEAQLRTANRVPPRYRVASGSTVLIPRDESMGDDIAPGMVNASVALVPENAGQRQITYRVRRGDTLASVARRWKVQPEDIVAWNELHGNGLFAGQRLVLTVLRGPAPAAHHRHAAAANKVAARATAASAAHL